MDLAPLVGAIEALMSPLAWDSREAWLAESLRRVGEARGGHGPEVAADVGGELEALLRLPGDEPGWLERAMACGDPEQLGKSLPAMADVPESLLSVVSLRCALQSGLAMLVLMDQLGTALPTTQELRVSFGLRGREPQVALLAAEGLSNAAIGERLRLSAHTVRHYLERVLDRLGLHTRKALALRLMGGGGERPTRGAAGSARPDR
jgi:DNA-binding CsgD family transcriptional regulator